MHAIIRRSLYGAVFAGGLLALGAGAANAADQSTPGAADALSGLEATVSVTVPGNILGNVAGVLGGAVDSMPPATGAAEAPTANVTAVLGAPVPAKAAGTTGVAGNPGGSAQRAALAVAVNAAPAAKPAAAITVLAQATPAAAVPVLAQASPSAAVPVLAQATPAAAVPVLASASPALPTLGGYLPGGVDGGAVGTVRVAVPGALLAPAPAGTGSLLGDVVGDGLGTLPATGLNALPNGLATLAITAVLPESSVVTPGIPAAPVVPGVPAAPVTPGVPTGPGAAPGSPVPTPAATVALGQAVTVQASGGEVAVPVAGPARLAYTGTGIWPIYQGAAVMLLIGLGLLLRLRSKAPGAGIPAAAAAGVEP